MSTDEQKQEVWETVTRLREKGLEKKCLYSKAQRFVVVLTDMLARHQAGQHDENFISLLDTLPGGDEVIRTFRELAQAKMEIGQLKETLEVE